MARELLDPLDVEGAVADGRSNAEYDFYHIGNDFALEIRGDGEHDFETGATRASSLAGAIRNRFLDFYKDEAREWFVNERERFEDNLEDAEKGDHRAGEAARRYAQAYVDRYMELILKRALEGVEDDVVKDSCHCQGICPDCVRDPGGNRKTDCSTLSAVNPLVSESWRKNRRYAFGFLLSPSSEKIEKSNSSQNRFLNAIQYLAPATMAGGPNLCPCSTRGCYGEAGENCIAGTGHLAHNLDTLIARSRFFLEQREAYLERLIHEIEGMRNQASQCGKRLALRLNGTSDVDWERRAGFSELFGMFPDVVFYDYTKIANRVVRHGRPVMLPRNYSLTFSRSEENDAEVEEVIRATRTNVAVVFSDPSVVKDYTWPLPRVWNGRRVIDGDLSDLRFTDPKGVIVGLRAKVGGLTKKLRKGGFTEAEGFVVKIGRRS